MIKIISLIIVIAFTIGCSSTSIKHVGKKEFHVIAKSINMPSIAITYKIIGTTKHRIYIERHDSILNKTTVYWTEKKNIGSLVYRSEWNKKIQGLRIDAVEDPSCKSKNWSYLFPIREIEILWPYSGRNPPSSRFPISPTYMRKGKYYYMKNPTR